MAAPGKSGSKQKIPARHRPGPTGGMTSYRNEPVTARAVSAASPGAEIDVALELAVESHRGQTDKYGQPYILHVLGVAARCRTMEEKTVAFLHDVVEDTDMTLDDLRKRGFSERIVVAVGLLTRHKGETYDAFVERIAPNPLARAVKLADLEDNMDFRTSNRTMKVKDAERMEKYRKAWQKIAALHTVDLPEEIEQPVPQKAPGSKGRRKKT
jgi:(p)ppGpp synthase/HD superfamily hydrolase